MNMDVGRMHIGPCIPGENRPGWESHRCSGNGQSEWIWIFQFRTIWMLLCNALDEI